jgi:hypothetical protein
MNVLNYHEEVTATLSSDPSERISEAELEVNQQREEESFVRYSNSYMYTI